jgi:hypothetical protein
MKNSLSSNGLSMSQSQSISNLCNQEVLEIDRQLGSYNNFSRRIALDGQWGQWQTITKARKIPDTLVESLEKKAKLTACQAFLMENIKAKDKLLKSLRNEDFIYDGMIPILDTSSIKMIDFIDEVNEDWGWQQLSIREVNEFFEEEAKAAQFGQFIHKGSNLDSLRQELAVIPDIEWMELKKGEQTPVEITVHHNSEELLKLHNDLAKIHREANQRVNYYKAKVKNLVSDENARIQKENSNIERDYEDKVAPLREKWNSAMIACRSDKTVKEKEFNSKKEMKIKEAAQLAIEVDTRFQSVIDQFVVKKEVK